MFGIIVLAVLGVVTIIGAFLLGSGGGARSVAPGQTGSEQTDPNASACDIACNEWDMRRAERCNAEADERVARSAAEARHNELNTALTTAGGLLAAAIAAAAITLIGWVVAAPLFAVASAATLAAAYIGGLVSRADADLARAEQNSHEARSRELDARTGVLTHCSSTEAGICFQRPSPC